MDRLYATIQNIEHRVNRFYNQVTHAHEHEKLRLLADPPLFVTKKKDRYSLFYGTSGFYVRSEGQSAEHEKNFHKKGNKLVVDTDQGIQEMLVVFPKLTLGTIEDRLCSDLEKNYLPRR
jgi:hypothetical protein